MGKPTGSTPWLAVRESYHLLRPIGVTEIHSGSPNFTIGHWESWFIIGRDASKFSETLMPVGFQRIFSLLLDR